MTSLKILTRPFRDNDKPMKIKAKVKRRYKRETSRLIFSALTVSKSTGDRYKTKIGFRVNRASKHDERPVTRVMTDERRWRLVKPSMRSRAKVSCTCKDYLYTFALPNKSVGAHLGRAPMLETIKGTGKRAPRNPKRKPGSCKHIQGLALKLKRKHYILE